MYLRPSILSTVILVDNYTGNKVSDLTQLSEQYLKVHVC